MPLPIELLSFTGKNQDDKNILSWTTASETNNDYFTLEKSSDANIFQPIAKIQGAGNSTTILNYSFTDESPLSFGAHQPVLSEVEGGVRYYRLKQTDFNGAFSYSKTIAINSNLKNVNDLLIYPNPAQNNFTVEMPVEIFDILITDFTGRKILEEKNIHFKISINVKFFPKGIYFLQTLTASGSVHSSKVSIK